MKTGKTTILGHSQVATTQPQWSPIMKTGKTHAGRYRPSTTLAAAMEPDHEDREDLPGAYVARDALVVPQWSPIMKTGKTVPRCRRSRRVELAAMEPDHEDREDCAGDAVPVTDDLAAMEPDHEDREDTGKLVREALFSGLPQWSPIMKTGKTRAPAVGPQEPSPGRNGARS